MKKKEIKLLFKHNTDNMRKMLFVNGVNIMAKQMELKDEPLHELLTWHNAGSYIQGLRSPLDIINALCNREEEGLDLIKNAFALGFAIAMDDTEYKIDLVKDLLKYEDWPLPSTFCMTKMDEAYDLLRRKNPDDPNIEVKTNLIAVFYFAGLMYLTQNKEELTALLHTIMEGFSDNWLKFKALKNNIKNIFLFKMKALFLTFKVH